MSTVASCHYRDQKQEHDCAAGGKPHSECQQYKDWNVFFDPCIAVARSSTAVSTESLVALGD